MKRKTWKELLQETTVRYGWSGSQKLYNEQEFLKEIEKQNDGDRPKKVPVKKPAANVNKKTAAATSSTEAANNNQKGNNDDDDDNTKLNKDEVEEKNEDRDDF